jgi:hypothetical protein
MSRQLSDRETAVLRAILDCMPHGGNWTDLLWRVRESLGAIGISDVTMAGVHRTAASLCRKDLAWRPTGCRPVLYKITQAGREALKGDKSGRWIAKQAGTACPACATPPTGTNHACGLKGLQKMLPIGGPR